MKLTVLGASPVRPNPGGACAGYLVERGGKRLLVDCGPGVLSRLQTLTTLDGIDAVVISHAHHDHFLDLIGLRYGVNFSPTAIATVPEIYVAPGMLQVLDAIGDALDPGGDFWAGLAIREYDPALGLELHGFALRFAPTRHYVDCWAIRIEADGQAIAYSADTGPCDDVVRLAAGADLLLVECTLPSRDGHEEEWGHLAPDEAAAIARVADVGRVLLTHTWSEWQDGLVEATRAGFGGPVALASELETYVLD